MKRNTKWFAGALALTGGLALITTAQAQYINSGQYLQYDPSLNDPSASSYGGWGPASFLNTPTGIEVDGAIGGNYGGSYFVLPVADLTTLNASDTQIQLTLTLNGDPNTFNWFSPGQLVFNDNNTPNAGAFYYGMPYFGYNNGSNPSVSWNGATATVTVPIVGGLLGNIQAGGDTIYAISLDMDPSTVSTPYSVTFNSIEFVPAPEPTTMALAGLGAAGLLAVRRRK